MCERMSEDIMTIAVYSEKRWSNKKSNILIHQKKLEESFFPSHCEKGYSCHLECVVLKKKKHYLFVFILLSNILVFLCEFILYSRS